MQTLRNELKVQKERVILVGAWLVGDGWKDDDLAELSALAESAGALVVDKFQQKIRKINPSTYIGKGKAQMLCERVQKYEANCVIFDNDLSPGQIRELEAIIKAKVLDRSELILDIFASRAKTRQAMVQVELAQLEYTYPRLTRMWSHLDTVAGAGGGTAAGAVGGIGTRGTGEKQLEIDRRIVSKRITELKRDLEEIDKRRMREISSRKDLFKICLVGYTNAGKSTLMNALTDAGVYVEDLLFATLDTRTRKWKLAQGADVLLSDTVGFVRKLPHQLVASFKATLEEAVNADLLLHVIDVSAADAQEQIESVNKVLGEIGCGEKPIIMLLNKSDAIAKQGHLETLATIYPSAITISAKTGMGLTKVHDAVYEKFSGGSVVVRVKNHLGRGKVQSFLRANAIIISEEYVDSSVLIEARLGKSQLGKLKHLVPDHLEVVE
ncbi:MAG: GTPase HflX [Planctomycetes bacterium GWF2_50_10]|nr:MAG: GTPase HflX [Planctomycetes bacterium GWF2_50_10]